MPELLIDVRCLLMLSVVCYWLVLVCCSLLIVAVGLLAADCSFVC